MAYNQYHPEWQRIVGLALFAGCKVKRLKSYTMNCYRCMLPDGERYTLAHSKIEACRLALAMMEAD